MKKKTKIVEIIADAQSVTYFNFFAEFSKKNENVELIFICLNDTPSPMEDDMTRLNCEYHWIYFNNQKRILSWFFGFFKLLKLFYKLKPDVVHSHLFDDGVISMLASKILGIKKRIHTKQCTTFHWFYSPKAVFLDRLINKWSTDIVAVSTEARDFLLEYEKAPKSKISLIHHGIPISTISAKDDKEINNFKTKFNLHGYKLVGTVSRYIEWKGYKYIIEAAKLLKNSYPNVKFLGVGNGPQFDELMNLIKINDLENQFILTGRIDKKLIPSVFQSLDVYVHSAFMEPFGFVIPEAMINKIPIVTTPTGSAKDALVHLESAYIFPYHNSEELAKGIEYMLTRDTKKFTELAYKRVNELYTIEKMWEKHYELYLR